MQRKYPHKVKEYIKNHSVTNIVSETDTLWQSTDGRISMELRNRIIKDIRETTIIVY